MYSQNELMSMQKIGTWADHPITFTTNFGRREVVVEFPYATPGPSEGHPRGQRIDRFKFVIQLRNLGTILELAATELEQSILIDLKSPPKFFRKLPDPEDSHDEGRTWYDFKSWSRQTEVARPGSDADDQPLTFKNDRALIDIGMNPVEAFKEFADMNNRSLDYNQIDV